MDVVLDDISCDHSLPFSIVESTFVLTCNGNKRCSFQGDTALAEGQFILNGIDDVQVDYNKIYFMGYLDTESSSIDIYEVSADLCNYATEENMYGDANNGDDAYDDDAVNGDDAVGDDAVGDDAKDVDDGYGYYAYNNNTSYEYNKRAQCDLQDGTYDFSTEMSVPVIAGTWIDTGWGATGQVIIYTYKREQIGACQVSFTTLSPIGPSAKTVFLVMLPLVGLTFFILTLVGLRRVIRNNRDDSDVSSISSVRSKGSKLSRAGSKLSRTGSKQSQWSWNKRSKKVVDKENTRGTPENGQGISPQSGVSGIEEAAAWETNKNDTRNEAGGVKCLAKMAVSVMHVAVRKSGDEEDAAYQRMEEAEPEAIAVSAQNDTSNDDATPYQHMEEAKVIPILISASSLTSNGEGWSYQLMDEAKTESFAAYVASFAKETNTYLCTEEDKGLKQSHSGSEQSLKSSSEKSIKLNGTPEIEGSVPSRSGTSGFQEAATFETNKNDTSSEPGSLKSLVETGSLDSLVKKEISEMDAQLQTPSDEEDVAFQPMEEAKTESISVAVHNHTGDDDATPYQHMEEPNSISIVVSASNVTSNGEASAYQHMEEAKTDSVAAYVASSANETNAHLCMEEDKGLKQSHSGSEQSLKSSSERSIKLNGTQEIRESIPPQSGTSEFEEAVTSKTIKNDTSNEAESVEILVEKEISQLGAQLQKSSDEEDTASQPMEGSKTESEAKTESISFSAQNHTGDDNVAPYHHMEEPNFISIVVSASNVTSNSEATAYQHIEEAKANAVAVSVASSANETSGHPCMEESKAISSADINDESKESRFIRFMSQFNRKATDEKKEEKVAPNNEVAEKDREYTLTDID